MLPLVLLPGMGGDRRMFAPQLAAFPNASVPDWLEPCAGESLGEYAGRMARAVDPGGPCLVGGASFGGMVAIEMAPHLQARACVLIGSIRSPTELPPRICMLRPWVCAMGGRGPDLLPACARVVHILLRRWLGPTAQSLLLQAAECDRRFLRWSALAVLQWQAPAPLSVPIAQIHGDRDQILPCRFTRPHVVIAGAGHLLSMTHAEAVNGFLRAQLAKYAGERC